MKHNRVELLAPAGNAAAFYGAVHAGADAVYMAGSQFGARAYAENFTAEELLECIRYGHLMGRKIYLTVNTLLKNPEMARLYDYLAPFYEAGLDAVIVQDLGVLRFIRTRFPGLKLHVSTQMTVCSHWGASLLKEMGASRIVPARELSLEEIASMRRRSGVEVEAFIHGAMCYCYSGQCLFSSILGGRSGNRGRCAQPCRLPYSVDTGSADSQERYLLSLKDMCTIAHIPALLEAGIDSFKIEGRMKKPEYAAGVTDIYRRSIDSYYALRETMGPERAREAYSVSQEDERALSSLYVRSGLQNGYLYRHNGPDMVTMDSPAYRESDESLLASIRETWLDSRLKLPVAVKAFFRVDSPAKVILEWGEVSAAVTAEPVSRALKQPITEENVRKQLSRLGDSAFEARQIEIFMDADCFYPLKQINELRRRAVAELERQILLARGCRTTSSCPPAVDIPDKAAASPSQKHGYAVYVRTKEQLEAFADWAEENPSDLPLRIYADGDLLAESWTAALPLCRRLSGSGALYAALPYILRDADEDYLRLLHRKVTDSGIFEGFLARSMDGFGFLAISGEEALSRRADAGVYVWNDSALKELSTLAEGFCLPYELTAPEQRHLWENHEKGVADGISCEKIVYGRIPMMITANCLRKTTGACKKGQGSLLLKDRYRKEFPVLINCTHCMNIIYNSVPLSLYQECAKWKGKTDLRLDFTLESPEEVKLLLDAFIKGAAFPKTEYTTGHEKRGVM